MKKLLTTSLIFFTLSLPLFAENPGQELGKRIDQIGQTISQSTCNVKFAVDGQVILKNIVNIDTRYINTSRKLTDKIAHPEKYSDSASILRKNSIKELELVYANFVEERNSATNEYELARQVFEECLKNLEKNN